MFMSGYFACTYVFAPHACLMPTKVRVSDPLEVELQMDANHLMGAFTSWAPNTPYFEAWHTTCKDSHPGGWGTLENRMKCHKETISFCNLGVLASNHVSVFLYGVEPRACAKHLLHHRAASPALFKVFFNLQWVEGWMAQWLRALTTLTEDWSWRPSTQVQNLISTCDSSSCAPHW